MADPSLSFSIKADLGDAIAKIDQMQETTSALNASIASTIDAYTEASAQLEVMSAAAGENASLTDEDAAALLAQREQVAYLALSLKD